MNRPTVAGRRTATVCLGESELQVVRYVLDHLLRERQLRGQRIPVDVRRLHARVTTALEIGDEPDSDDTEITTAQAATILGYTERYVRMIAPSLDGRRLGRDWTFPKAAVIEYAQSRTVA